MNYTVKDIGPYYERSDGPIHTWFSLSYNSYFVCPRSALQAMPLDWQQRFVDLIEEADDFGIETPTYSVQLRDETGRFMRDPWREYRHPDFSLLPEILRPECAHDNSRIPPAPVPGVEV